MQRQPSDSGEHESTHFPSQFRCRAMDAESQLRRLRKNVEEQSQEIARTGQGNSGSSRLQMRVLLSGGSGLTKEIPHVRLQRQGCDASSFRCPNMKALSPHSPACALLLLGSLVVSSGSLSCEDVSIAFSHTHATLVARACISLSCKGPAKGAQHNWREDFERRRG